MPGSAADSTLPHFHSTSGPSHHRQMHEYADEDSDFDWDGLPARTPPRADRPSTVMDRLAWIVLLLLVFCPPLGFALATLWR